MGGDTKIKEEGGTLEEGDFWLVHAGLCCWSGQAETHLEVDGSVETVGLGDTCVLFWERIMHGYRARAKSF